jgi:hypothetical protein
MVNYQDLQNEIDEMKSGEKKPIGSKYDVDEFEGVYAFLLELKKSGVIHIVETKSESMSGHRKIWAAFIQKI